MKIMELNVPESFLRSW